MKSKMSDTELQAFRRVGALGGKASAKNLSAKQRTERARKAGLARQANARKAGKP